MRIEFIIICAVVVFIILKKVFGDGAKQNVDRINTILKHNGIEPLDMDIYHRAISKIQQAYDYRRENHPFNPDNNQNKMFIAFKETYLILLHLEKQTQDILIKNKLRRQMEAFSPMMHRIDNSRR